LQVSEPTSPMTFLRTHIKPSHEIMLPTCMLQRPFQGPCVPAPAPSGNRSTLHAAIAKPGHLLCRSPHPFGRCYLRPMLPSVHLSAVSQQPPRVLLQTLPGFRFGVMLFDAWHNASGTREQTSTGPRSDLRGWRAQKCILFRLSPLPWREVAHSVLPSPR
jgi:hypothetical protein